MKPRKSVDPEAIRKRTDKAILALRKSVVIAGREGWITSERISILNSHILGVAETFMLSLPRTEPESESEACLPF